MTPLPPISDWRFARRVLIVMGLAALALVAWKLAYVLMLVFAAVLLAIILRGIALLVTRYTGLSSTVSLGIAIATFFVAMLGFVYLFGVQLYHQVVTVFESLPKALGNLSDRTGLDIDTDAVLDHGRQLFSGAGLSRAVNYGSTAAAVIVDTVLIVVGGIYFATGSNTYRRGIALLAPPTQRTRLMRTAGAVAHALRQWFGGQLVAMLAVGLASWGAYAWIGLPSAGVLALIAGVANFVPMVGPIVGSVPAVLVASTQGVETLLWTLGAAVVIQQLESYALMPIVQKHAVDMPPAMGLFAILVFGSLFGVVGVILGVPLAVALMVVVQTLWVNQVLGEDIAVLGEEDEEQDHS